MKATLAALLAMQLACASQSPAPAPEPEVVTVDEPPPSPAPETPPPRTRWFDGDGAGRIMGMGDIDTGGGTPRSDEPRPPRPHASVSYRTEFSEQCLAGNVESVIKRRFGAFKACYEQRVQVHPKLAGTARVMWQIGTDGIPSRIRVTDDGLRDAEVLNCLRRTVGRAKFEHPPAPCQVSWWFTFGMVRP